MTDKPKGKQGFASMTPERRAEVARKGGKSARARAKDKQGFASLTPERRAEIARQGGKAVQAKGAGHKFTAEEAGAARVRKRQSYVGVLALGITARKKTTIAATQKRKTTPHCAKIRDQNNR